MYMNNIFKLPEDNVVSISPVLADTRASCGGTIVLVGSFRHGLQRVATTGFSSLSWEPEFLKEPKPSNLPVNVGQGRSENLALRVQGFGIQDVFFKEF